MSQDTGYFPPLDVDAASLAAGELVWWPETQDERAERERRQLLATERLPRRRARSLFVWIAAALMTPLGTAALYFALRG